MIAPHAAATVSDAIAAELRVRVHLRGWSGARVARMLDVDPLWVTRRLSGTTALTVEDLFTVCAVIGAHPVDLVAQVEEDLRKSEEAIERQPEVDTESTGRGG